MKNRVQLFRKAKHWTQIDLASHVGAVSAECITPSRRARFGLASPRGNRHAAALSQYL
jgi:hypothetical protein